MSGPPFANIFRLHFLTHTPTFLLHGSGLRRFYLRTPKEWCRYPICTTTRRRWNFSQSVGMRYTPIPRTRVVELPWKPSSGIVSSGNWLWKCLVIVSIFGIHVLVSLATIVVCLAVVALVCSIVCVCVRGIPFNRTKIIPSPYC